MASVSARIVRVASLLVWVSACAGDPPGSLSGRVVLTGVASVEGAVVELSGPTSTPSDVGADGVFAATGLAPGAYVVVVRVPSTRESSVVRVARVVSGEEESLGDVTFSAVGSVTGTLVKPDGSGASGALVIDTASGAVTAAREDGRFELAGLSPGSHTLQAALEGFRTFRLPAVDVAWNRVAVLEEAQFVLPPPSPGAIEGRVTDASGAGLPGVAVVASGPSSGAAFTDESGGFRISALADGTYAVSFHAADVRERVVVRRAVVTSAVVSLAAVVLSPVGAVRGVVSAGGGPVAGALVAVEGSSRVVPTDGGGRFVLEGLDVGPHTLVAQGAGWTAAEATFEVTRGGTTEVEVTLTATPRPSGRIVGRARVAGGTRPVVVTLSGAGQGVTVSGTDGAFAFDGVPDGLSVVTLSADDTVEALRRMTIEVRDGAEAVLPDVVLTGTGRLAGRVTRGGSDTGLAGTLVALDGGRGTTIAGHDGTFSFERAPAGTRTVVAQLDGWGAASATVNVIHGDATTLAAPLDLVRLRPDANAGFSGRIVLTGEASTGAQTVFVSGPVSTATLTADDGSWSVEGLVPGTYVVTASVAASVEQAVSVRLATQGPAEPVPDLVLTPAGTVTGRVTLALATTGLAGTLVASSGSGAVAFTSATGDYVLTRVPSGPQTLWIQRPGWQPVSTTLTVLAGGTVAAGTTDLARGGAPENTLVGRALLAGRTTHASTTVSVDGGRGTATTSATGDFTLVGVPDGIFSVTLRNGTNAFEETVPGLLFAPGGRSLLVDGFAYPLPPIELPRGKRVVTDEGPDGPATPPVLSPDARLTFHVGAAGAVWLVTVATRDARALEGPVAPGTAPLFLSDGSRVLYRTAQGILRSVDTTTLASVDVAIHVDVDPSRPPAISSDGARVAVRYADGRWLSHPVAGGAGVSLAAASTPADVVVATPAAAGAARFVTCFGGSIGAVPAAGGTPVALTTGVDPSSLRWSPDGRRLVVRVVSNGALRVVDFSVAVPAVSAAFAVGGAPDSLLFTADSTRLGWRTGDSVFSVAFANTAATPDLAASDVDADATPGPQLVNAGTRLLYKQRGAVALRVTTLLPSATPLTVTPALNALHAWRWAGNPATGTPRVLWVATDTTNTLRLQSRLADGSGTPLNLAVQPATDFVPTPDGTRVAWRSLADATWQQVRVASTSTTTGTFPLLTGGPECLETLQFAPNGTTLACRSAAATVQVLKSTDTAPTTLLTRAPTARPVFLANDRIAAVRQGMPVPLRFQDGLYILSVP